MPTTKIDKFDDLDDHKGDEIVTAELNVATEKLRPVGNAAQSWDRASKIVREFRPVPWILWRITYSVFGKVSQTGNPDPIVFDPVKPLVLKAGNDPTLMRGKTIQDPHKQFEETVKIIGGDVAAALCVLHAVCRRIKHSLAERVWKPILDDALMRAQIGYHVGEHCKQFGAGRGMLAGFAGRSGLATLISYGDLTQAQRTLEGLATGREISEVGIDVYGCDPLQIAAMTLAGAGCNFDAAFGIASYSSGGREVQARSESMLWLSAFAISEALRMNQQDTVDKRYWDALGFNLAQQGELKERVRQLHRKGPSWRWLIEAQSEI